MATATVEIWRDTGFTEGSVEVPSKTSSLPSPTYTFSNINVQRKDMFSSVKLAHPFEELYDCSYLRITLDMNNGADVILYGWIDTVSCASDTAGYPNTVIDWHPDLWRSYINSAQFGAGVVTKRPYGSDCPPQTYPYRFKDVQTTTTLVDNGNIWWVVFKFVDKFLNKTTSCIGCFPIDTSDSMRYFEISAPNMHNTSETITVRTIPFAYLALGMFEELLELDPKTLISVYLCPFDPLGCTQSGSTLTKSGAYAYKTDNWNPPIGFFVYTSDTPFEEYTTTTTGLYTDDIFTTLVTDFMGNTVGAIPWGFTVDTWKYRLVMDANQAYVDLRGYPKYTEYGVTDTETRGTMTPVMGTDFTIPLIPVEITENSLASYVYSGQRNADRAALMSSALSSVTGGLVSVPNNMLQGYLFANAGGGTSRFKMEDIREKGDALRAWNSMVDNPNWAGFGAIGNPTRSEYNSASRELGYMDRAATAMMRASAVGGTIGTAASAGVSLMSATMQYANKQLQVSAQSNNLIMMGTGFDMFTYGQPITAVTMVSDAYSRNQREKDLELNGASVAEARENITSLIDAGGPLQILNPVVKGPIPTPAKEYIKQRLESGVRII